ncbi:hypothetical protein V8E54_008416 [Elaphomyces granulatus]
MYKNPVFAPLNALLAIKDPRRRVLALKWDEIPDKDLEKYQIQHIHFDFEKYAGESLDISPNPPILFRPLSSKFFNQHPIDMEVLGDSEVQELLDFPDYNPSTDPEAWDYGLWGADSCARQICSQLTVWAYDIPRVGVSRTFLHLFNVDIMSNSNPFLRDTTGLRSKYPTHHQSWDTMEIFEYERREGHLRPHIILITAQDCNGRDGSILLGELAQIITAMRNRAIQPRVLMISLLGPQHGRLFYGCMGGQSKIYSFEKI